MSDNVMNNNPKHGERCMSQCGTTAHEARLPLNLPPEVIKTILQNVCGKMAPDAGFDRRAEDCGYVDYGYDDEPYEDDEFYDEEEEEDDEPMTLMLNDGGEEFKVRLKVQSYGNGNLAVVLLYWDEDFWDIWTTVTIGSTLLLCDQDCAYIDTKTNGREIVDWLKRNKLVIREKESFSADGWPYPYCCFDPDALRKFDPEGYDEYLECWKMYNMWDE